MKPNENITALANNCDLLICEATFPDKMASVAHNLYHSTPRDAAEIASKANAKSLALIHISPMFSKLIQKFKKQAEKNFKGKVIIPNDLEVLHI
jgi:ribonuclease Z